MPITMPTIAGTPAAVSMSEAGAASFGASAGAFEAVFLSEAVMPRDGGAPDGAAAWTGSGAAETNTPGLSEPETTPDDEVTGPTGEETTAPAGPESAVVEKSAAAERLAALRAQFAEGPGRGPDTSIVNEEGGLQDSTAPALAGPGTGSSGDLQDMKELASALPSTDGNGASESRGRATSAAGSPLGHAFSFARSNPVPATEKPRSPDTGAVTAMPPIVRAQARTPAEAAGAAWSKPLPVAGISASMIMAPTSEPQSGPSPSSLAGSTSDATKEPRPTWQSSPGIGAEDGAGFHIRPPGAGWPGAGTLPAAHTARASLEAALPRHTQQPAETKGGEQVLLGQADNGDTDHRPRLLPTAGEIGANRQSHLAAAVPRSRHDEQAVSTFERVRGDPPGSEARPAPEVPGTAPTGAVPSAASAHAFRKPGVAAPATAQPQAMDEGTAIGSAAQSGELPMPSDIEIPEIRGGSDAFGAERSSARQDVAATRGTETRSPIVQQIADVIGDPRDGSIEVELHPRELGRVRMSFSMAEGSLSVSVSADRPDTLDAIRRNIDQLASDLRTFGYRSIAFDFGGAGAGGEQGTWANRERGEVRPSIAADGITEVDLPSGPAPAASTGLDLRL